MVDSFLRSPNASLASLLHGGLLERTPRQLFAMFTIESLYCRQCRPTLPPPLLLLTPSALVGLLLFVLITWGGLSVTHELVDMVVSTMHLSPTLSLRPNGREDEYDFDDGASRLLPPPPPPPPSLNV